LTAVNQSIATETAGAARPAAGEDTFQAGRVVTIAAGHGVHDSYTAFLAPLLVIFKQTMGLSNTQAGLLSVFMQEASLVQPLIGGLADKFSVRYFVILAPAVTAIAMSLLGVAPSYLMLAILLTITGLSSACLHAVGPVMTGDVSGKRKLGMGMSIWMVGGESGRFIGPLVIGIVITTWGVRNTPWLMIGGLLASLALLLTLKEPPGHRAAQARPKSTLRAELRGKRRLLAVLIGIIVIQVFMSSALVTYLPILLHDEGESFWLASVSLSVLQAAGVVGALFGGTLSDRLGRRRMLSLSILPTSFFMFLFLTASGWVRFPLLLILGLTSLSITPVVMAIVQESFPNNRSLANGFYMALSFLIRSSAVLITGRLGDLFGMHTAFAVCAIIPLLGLPLLRFLPVKRSPQPAA
jgi:FSR family fosmidomycin resistance protein-like MFS transporter